MLHFNNFNMATNILRSRTNYILLGLIPIIAFTALLIYTDISPWWYIGCSLIYAFLYRPLLNLGRLRALGIERQFSTIEILFVLGFKHFGKLHSKQ